MEYAWHMPTTETLRKIEKRSHPPTTHRSDAKDKWNMPGICHTPIGRQQVEYARDMPSGICQGYARGGMGVDPPLGGGMGAGHMEYARNILFKIFMGYGGICQAYSTWR